MSRRRTTTPEEAADYDRYVRSEWNLFDRNPSRAQASLDAAGSLDITRVLDIGCGAGQELLPFVARQGTFGLGLDAAPGVGHVGRQLLGERHLSGRVAFARGLAESLPCSSHAFDLIICRLALPYTRNVQALAEMARVLRPGGLLLLKYHHARFYLVGLKRAIAAADIHAMLYTIRVLIAGTVYLLTGRQPNNWILGSECFQTESRIARELLRHGLVVRNVTSDWTPRTPSVVVIKARRSDLDTIPLR